MEQQRLRGEAEVGEWGKNTEARCQETRILVPAVPQTSCGACSNSFLHWASVSPSIIPQKPWVCPPPRAVVRIKCEQGCEDGFSDLQSWTGVKGSLGRDLVSVNIRGYM